MPRLTYYPHSVRSKRPGQIVDVPWAELAAYLESCSTDVRSKGASGYWVAAACHGPHSDAACESTDLVALDWEGSEPELSGVLFVAHTTDSHSSAEPRWRVWVQLDRAYSGEELRRVINPWAHTAALRAISQPAFVPTMGNDIWWLDCITHAHRAPWAPALAPAETPPPPAPPRPTTARQVPSQASTNALVTRWLANPDGTNRLAGALGSVLAEWGWSDADIQGYLKAWLHADPKLAKHTDDALRGAAKRRAGDRIVGFPALTEAGVDFQPERPERHVDISAVLLAADATPAPADDRFKFYSADAIASAELAPPNWLCSALVLAPGAPALISGYGGSGKTTFVQHLAVCVAQGEPLLGQYPVRAASVVHLDHEQGLSLTMRVYQALGLRADARLKLASFPRWSLADDSVEAREAFVRVVPRDGLVVIDSFLASCAQYLENGENDSSGRRPLDFLTQLSEATGATFLVIHHSRKDRSDRGASIRGTSALNDAVSLHISYEREDRAERPVLALGKVRNIAPAGALVGDEVEVALEHSAGGRMILSAVDAQAVASAKCAALDDSIVGLLSTGPWTGSKNELVDYLGKRRADVLQGLNRLEQNGIIVCRKGIIELVPAGSGETLKA